MALLGVAQARAQDVGGAASEPASEATGYQAVIDRAVADYAAGRFGDALAGFEQAHALQPSARTLRGIGLSAFYSGERARARVALEAALIDARKPLPDDQRRDVQALLESGLRAPDADDPVLQVAAMPSAPDAVSPPPATPPSLQPTAPIPQPTEPVASKPPAVEPTHAQRPGLLVTWIAAAAVPAFGAAAAAAWFTGSAKHDAIVERCEHEGCTREQARQRASDAGLSAHETWTSVCLVGAGVALVTASVAFVLESGHETGEATDSGLSWTSSGPSTTLRAQF